MLAAPHHPGALTADPLAPPLSLRLFGPLEIRLRGAPFPHLRFRKSSWLLALLALNLGRELERDWLAGLLWPESSGPAALANLRSSLKELRRALGAEAGLLQAPQPRTLCLDPTGVWTDAARFDRAIADGGAAALGEAVALYRGPLLENCAEEWVVEERRRREEAWLQALETLAARALAEGDSAAAERHLRRAVATDPLRETAHRAFMQALAAGGNYAAALLAYRDLRLHLHREGNVEPDPETTALFQQLRAQTRRRGQERAAALPSLSTELTGESLAPVPLPEGTVTFLFSDIEGSTRLWEQCPEAMRTALDRHDALLHHVIRVHAGAVFKTVGDQFCAAFATAPAALAAALAAQRALQAEPWEGMAALPVRMALHTGTVILRDKDYIGLTLSRAARLLAATHGGQILLSLATQDLVRDHLPDGAGLRDLGEHRLKDLSQPERIFQLAAPGLPGDFPPVRSLEAFAHNLPTQLTSFIGREREIAAVKQFLSSAALVTLTGSGGCGKTRLALQMAAELLEVYADGVWLVELASLADPGLVPQQVAAALGVREQPGQPWIETLVSALRPKRLLLVVDNCEHLLAGCVPLIDRLLHSCPALRMLATSREALGMLGETCFRIPALSFPEAEGPRPDPAALLRYEAVHLFVDRAAAASPAFSLTGENAGAVARLCRRLDGIPLALELAAGRVRGMPVAALAERLDDRFRLLTAGNRAGLPRHQTLRAMIGWSYDLLAPAEKVLLRRLSVFAGGWSLEAAEAVCSDCGLRAVSPADEGSVCADEGRRSAPREFTLDCGLADKDGTGSAPPSLSFSPIRNPQSAIRNEEALDLLTRLVDKSLVVYEGAPPGAPPPAPPEGRHRPEGVVDGGRWSGEEARYRLLETMRQFAQELLVASGESDAVRREHAQYYRALAEKAEPYLTGPDQQIWLERLEQERDNLRAALGWAAASTRSLPGSEATEIGLPLATAVTRFWYIRGDYTEGRGWLADLLSPLGEERHPGAEVPPAVRARALHAAAVLASAHGAAPAARPLLQESLSLARELEDRSLIGLSLKELGVACALIGEMEAARSHFEESLTHARELGDRHMIAVLCNGLGVVARELGEYERSRFLLEESLRIARAVGDRQSTGTTLANLGILQTVQGDYPSALAYYEESMATARELGDRRMLTVAYARMGMLACYQRDLGTARARYRESLRIQRALGGHYLLLSCLIGLGCVEIMSGEPAGPGGEAADRYLRRGTRLLAAAEALREVITGYIWVHDRPDYEHCLALARTALGEEAFAAAWAEGRAMPLEAVVALALGNE